ncbi:MAG: hypothetical protein QNJ97_02150 [Myxococcota bacterium]|nr:hypothetical protein [Myxococcota bacterium]
MNSSMLGCALIPGLVLLIVFDTPAIASSQDAPPAPTPLRVLVLDSSRKPQSQAAVRIDLELAGGELKTFNTETDRSGIARFSGLPTDCRTVQATARFRDAVRQSRLRTCSGTEEMFIVLPNTDKARATVVHSDLQGNPLPPFPPGLGEKPRFRDPDYVKRYIDPGIIGMVLRAGAGFCTDWSGAGTMGCLDGRTIGFSIDGGAHLYLFQWWKLSFALGGVTGYRQDPSPIYSPEDDHTTNHLITAGPRIYVDADAGDWVFGFDAVPMGAVGRITRNRAQGTSRGMDAYISAGLYLGWRAWGHVPIGLALDLFTVMTLSEDQNFPPGSILLSVFASRRIGPGSVLFE